MSFQLTFRDRHQYETSDGAITVAAFLSSGDSRVRCVAQVDTGAAVCLFGRELAEALGIDVESGHQIYLSTLVGSLPADGHEVTLEALGLKLHTTVYFVAHDGLERNLLGKFGWLQQVRLGIVDYDEKIYLSAYDDPA
jgi:predicted aspartyl protease